MEIVRRPQSLLTYLAVAVALVVASAATASPTPAATTTVLTVGAPATGRSIPTDTGQLRAYATRAPNKTLRIVVINEGAGACVVRVRLPARTRARTGTLELLTAPSIRARSGVTLGAQSYGKSTTTGLLAGPQRTRTVAPAHDGYMLRVPPASAALLTVGQGAAVRRRRPSSIP